MFMAQLLWLFSQQQGRPRAVAKRRAEYKVMPSVEAQNQIFLITQQAGKDYGRTAAGTLGNRLRQPGQRTGEDIGANQIIWCQRPDRGVIEPIGANRPDSR